MEGERALKTAVKNARSSFYERKGKVLSRKDMRKKNRLNQKKKNVAFEESSNDQAQEKPKRKKRKRQNASKLNQEMETDGISSERAAYLVASNADEKIISSLGKKLKVGKAGKVPKTFEEDGLDYLLDVCEPLGGGGSDRNSSDDEYLAMKTAHHKQPPAKKKRLPQATDKQDVCQGNPRGDEGADSISEGDPVSEHDEDSACGQSDENQEDIAFDESPAKGLPRDRVNEYDDDEEEEEEDDEEDDDEDELDDDREDEVDASIVDGGADSKKVGMYIPPAKRKLQETSSADDSVRRERLKKQLKGSINRLSSATLPSLLSEVEAMYSNSSRNLLNDVLYELIASACCPGSRMSDRLLLEHMMLVAALHTRIGTEVGSFFLEQIIETFHKLHESKEYEKQKDIDNLVIMVVALYHFKVVESLLIYDIIRRLIDNFKEKDVDLILSILKTCGPEIRKDDPSSLKDIILQVQAKSVSSVDLNDNLRMRFMLETITALKNNNMRKIPSYDPAVVEEAKKTYQLLCKGKSTASSGVRLKVSLDDLVNAKIRGRWWIVGSAWSGHGPNANTTQAKGVAAKSACVTTSDVQVNARLLNVAKQQRMNTELRRTVFCAIMTSEDYVDAFDKLLKMKLKEKQARDIVHVVVDCCLQEKEYNPFYEHLSDKLCSLSRSNQVTFQYTCWDRFKSMSSLSTCSRENLARLLAHLFASKSLSLSVLKVVTFGSLDEVAVKFFSLLFSLLFQFPKNVIKTMFKRISTLPKLSLLREGIKIFLRRFLLKSSESAHTQSDDSRMRALVQVAEHALDGQEYEPL